METKALREAIELSLRLTNEVKRFTFVPHHRVDLQADTDTVGELAKRFQHSAFSVASEFIGNLINEEQKAHVYLHKLEIAVTSMSSFARSFSNRQTVDVPMPVGLCLWGAIEFSQSFDRAIQPYYEGPKRLSELTELIEAEKALNADRGGLSAEEADKINAKLVYVRDAGIYDGMKKEYIERGGKFVKEHMAVGLAYLLGVPRSFGYIKTLLGNLEGYSYTAKTHNPFSFNSVTGAMAQLQAAKLKPSAKLQEIHKVFVLNNDAPIERKTSPKN